MALPAYAYTHSFSQAHSITFFSDNLRNTLREVIRENGLNPYKLTQDWETIERGIQTWLRSGDLLRTVVEFYRPGASYLSARWDFPISYAGSGAHDEIGTKSSCFSSIMRKTPTGRAMISQPGKVGSSIRTMMSSGSPSSPRVLGMKP